MMKNKKKIFEIALTLLELLRCEILATRGRFYPAFHKIGCHMNTRAAECMKIGAGAFFRNGNPFLKSKIPKNEPFGV